MNTSPSFYNNNKEKSILDKGIKTETVSFNCGSVNIERTLNSSNYSKTKNSK